MGCYCDVGHRVESERVRIACCHRPRPAAPVVEVYVHMLEVVSFLGGSAFRVFRPHVLIFEVVLAVVHFVRFRRPPHRNVVHMLPRLVRFAYRHL